MFTSNTSLKSARLTSRMVGVRVPVVPALLNITLSLPCFSTVKSTAFWTSDSSVTSQWTKETASLILREIIDGVMDSAAEVVLDVGDDNLGPVPCVKPCRPC